MPLTLEDLIVGLKQSRQHFHKHLIGIRDDQWDWRPYPANMTIRETLAHLIADDRATIQCLQGREPDYEACQEAERDIEKLQALLAESHQSTLQAIRDKLSDTPLDTIIDMYGAKLNVAAALSYVSSEDYYHAGQIGYIRVATDPEWDYYGTIYG